ncbi:Cysteine and histidine-rich protein 1-A [Chelonia mydas]|uniref:Cysteine and histidine-rich protein 1-A n=2 Tax=Chelonioidea TaxID=27791 RepID=M7AN19_CHEMY|nr:Cysteine and histidine-rich protein 1-A [Chelonia mydas]
MATVPPPGLKFKLILLGDFGVGKTTLFHRIRAGRFLQGAHTADEHLAICERTVQLSLPQAPRLAQAPFRAGPQGAVQTPPIFLLGNKTDLEPCLPEDKAEKFSVEHRIAGRFNVSAKTGPFTKQKMHLKAWCTNGHLMCAGCFIHLLADARLKEEQATCPNCRCEISKSLCCRNLAVEKAVSELPSECGFCMRQFPRSLLERHQKEECQDRVTQCKYKRIGCPWQGPYHELTVHEAECTHPTKTGNELMEILDEMDQTHKKEMQLYNSIFSLLSFEKIGYTEVQFRPYRTDDFITRLYYETPRFTVLNQTWVLKARVNDSERNPNLSCKRTLSFQLILKSKISSPMECSFLLLKGPYDDVKINPVIYHFVFTNENNETEYVPLPIIDSVECNKLLAAKNINLRLFIFQIQK